MPARRLLMRKIREVLRLKHERGLSHRAIAQACAIGVGTVTLYLKRTAQQGLGWPLPAELDDSALEAQLFPRPVPVRNRVRPDCAYIHRELKRDGVTLQLLWEEHLQVHPSGYRYTQFCEVYRQWVKRLRPVDATGPPRRREARHGWDAPPAHPAGRRAPTGGSLLPGGSQGGLPTRPSERDNAGGLVRGERRGSAQSRRGTGKVVRTCSDLLPQGNTNMIGGIIMLRKIEVGP